MYLNITKKLFDLVLVTLGRSKEGKEIFSLQFVCGLSGITVEIPHKRTHLHNAATVSHVATQLGTIKC